MTATLAAHADWSLFPGKRWLTRRPARRRGMARRGTGIGRRSGAPLPARLLAAAGGGAVALGVDLPLGLPRRYAALYATLADFPAFLRGLAHRPDFFAVCATLAEVGAGAAVLSGARRARHDPGGACGGPRARRCRRAVARCDRATAERPAGAPLFWTLGANQSGKAAIAAWRDFLLPALAPPRRPGSGRSRATCCACSPPGAIVVAETYPAEALRHLGLRMGGSKRRQADRAALARPLRAAMAALSARARRRRWSRRLADGFGADAAGEDRFDSLLGVLCVLGVLDGVRPDGVPDDPWIRRWEGWVLGQTALPAMPAAPLTADTRQVPPPARLRRAIRRGCAAPPPRWETGRAPSSRSAARRPP